MIRAKSGAGKKVPHKASVEGGMRTEGMKARTLLRDTQSFGKFKDKVSGCLTH